MVVGGDERSDAGVGDAVVGEGHRNLTAELDARAVALGGQRDGDVAGGAVPGKIAGRRVRPWNWASRRDWSLATLVRSTLNVAVVTTDFAIVMAPVTAAVRPTAVLPWPASVSPTR